MQIGLFALDKKNNDSSRFHSANVTHYRIVYKYIYIYILIRYFIYLWIINE